MATDEKPGDGADENQTVMHSPSFDELLAMREGEAAVAALDPADEFEGGSTQIAPSGSFSIGDDGGLSEAERQQVAMAQTAMGPSYDERLAAQGAAPPGFGGGFGGPPPPHSAPVPPPPGGPPVAPSPFAASPTPAPAPFSANPSPAAPSPFAASPSPAVAPSPFAASPAAAAASPAAAAHDMAPPKDPNVAKTMALSAADMASLGGLPGSGPVPAGFGAPQSAPGAFGPPGAAPAPFAPPAQPGMQPAAPPKQGLDAVKLFVIALGATFLLGSCLGTGVLFMLLR